jgi:hypothetical protein
LLLMSYPPCCCCCCCCCCSTPSCCLQERDAEKSRVNAERLASERSFYSELQRQEADSKSGGQRGMNPHKKKKGRQ